MVDSKKKPGTKVLMFNWNEGIMYADRCLRLTQSKGMPLDEQLPWMERKDRLTRHLANTYVALHWPYTEAMDEAVTVTAPDWSYIHSGNVISEHQSITDLDPGMHHQGTGANTTPLGVRDGGSSSAWQGWTGRDTTKLSKKQLRFARTALGGGRGKGNGKGGKAGKTGKSKNPLGKGAKKNVKSKIGNLCTNYRGRKFCGGFNGKRGCPKSESMCPQWGEHRCGYIVAEDGTVCGATDHGYADH